MQDHDYENVAFDILKGLNDDQTNGIFKPLGQIAEQSQGVKSNIEKYVSKYIAFQEQVQAGCIAKLHKPLQIVQHSLTELFNTKKYVSSSYENIKDSMEGRFAVQTVKQANLASWKSLEARKSYLKYYGDLIALCSSCKDVKSVFEDILIKFKTLTYET